MAKTNFAALTSKQKAVWQRDIWHTARQKSFIMSASGSDINSVFQRITELTPTERGDQAIITLVPDLEEDGAMGDTGRSSASLRGPRPDPRPHRRADRHMAGGVLTRQSSAAVTAASSSGSAATGAGVGRARPIAS